MKQRACRKNVTAVVARWIALQLAAAPIFFKGEENGSFSERSFGSEQAKTGLADDERTVRKTV